MLSESQSNQDPREIQRIPSAVLLEEQKQNEVQSQQLQQPGFNELNQNMANLQVNSDQALQNQQLDSQSILNQFFSQIAQSNQQQPVLNNQVQEEVKQEEVVQVAQQNNNDSNNSSSLIGGMSGLNRALDEIRNDLHEIPNGIERIIDNSQVQNSVQQQEGGQIGSSLIEQVEDNIQQLSIQAQQIAEQPVQEEQQNEGEVEMTYGFPNSLLIANDIEPSMLDELPEDLRNDILSTIRDQLEEWQANQALLRQQNQQPPQQQQNQNVQQEVNQQAQNNDQAQAQEQQQNLPQAQVQQPIVIPVQQEVQDPEIAQAIAMGIDPEFVASLPREMLRELIQNDQFRAENLGVPQPVQQQPGRGPEEIDVASIIASTQDPGLRREMLLNLSIEQTNLLPAALRTEALNMRRGRLPDGLLQQDLRAGGPIRFDRGVRRDMPGDRPRNHDDFIERQMEMFMNRIRGEHDNLDPHLPHLRPQASLIDPSKKQFDEIVVSFTQELDQECQDKNLLAPQKNLKIINMIQEQLVEDSFLTPLNDLKDIQDSEQEDRMLKNILLTVCLNHNIKTDVVQFLRLIMKNKTEVPQNNSLSERKTSQSALSTTNDNQQSYQFRNKIINTLTFVLQIASNQDLELLLSLFEIKVSKDQLSQIVMSSYQWNRIFLTVTGVLRVLIDSNKKLILHMLKSLIQRDEYFIGKGDHIISSHAKILFQQKQKSQSDQIDSSVSQINNVKPPLAIIIQIMRDQSEQYHSLNRQNEQQTDEQVNQKKEKIIRVRNIKLLIQDIIKQFELLFEDISSNQQQKLQNPQFSINLGEMSLDSVQSLTDLLYLPYIDKKLLTVLSDFIYRMSDLCLVSAQSKKNQITWQKDLDNSKRNFLMINKQCENIGSQNLKIINQVLNQILMVFGSFDIQAQQNQSFSKNLSNIDRQNSQISDGNKIFESFNKDVQQLNQPKRKINQDCEKQISELFNQLKQECSPFLHVLSLKSYLFQKLVKDKQKYNECISTLVPFIEDIETQITKFQEDIEKNKSSIEQKNKDKEAHQQTIKQYETLIKLKDEFLMETRAFYKDELIQILIHQISQILSIVQQTDMKLNESIKILLNCAFDCFMPEMQDEVIRKQSDLQRGKKSSKEESKNYVQMESIKKILNQEEEQNATMQINEQSSLITPIKSNARQDFMISESNSKVMQSNRIIFRNVEEDASDRLLAFNMFCLQNKDLLNKIVKDLYNNNQVGQNEGDVQLKELSTVSEFIKYMPNLLDFENKRQYFKKEIKKLRKLSNSRQLHLSIRRKEIFMDSFSQLNHLTPKELKGKIKVDFAGERGMDVGGLTRDFFIELSKEMFNQNYSLFIKSANGSTYMPNQKSYVQPDHIRFFKFIGRVIGKALFEGCLLECYFVKSIYKMLIGQKLNFRDLEDFDNDLYVGLNWCLQPHSDVEALYETFSITVDYFGKTEVIDLIPNGRNIDVTSENKYSYVESKAYHQLYKSVQQQIDSFLEGFYEIIPRDLISIFTYKELELLISGMPDFKISDLKQHTNYNGYTANSPQIIWFWEIMETLDRTEKGNFLQFVTGSSKVPVEGFQSLQGMNGPEKFQITRILAKDCMRLPQGHTCFNQLDLPEYPSKEILHERLMWAIKETSGFGFA